MVLTMTMNPAPDKSTTVEKMLPEKKLRCGQPVIEAGGGGINEFYTTGSTGSIDSDHKHDWRQP